MSEFELIERDVICPTCGGIAAASQTRYGLRHDCCGLWSWGGKPLVDAETHAARQAAHRAFDRLWKDKMMRRGKAYRRLANVLGVPEPQAHMSVMSKELASRVPDAVAAIMREIANRPANSANCGTETQRFQGVSGTGGDPGRT